MAFSSSEFPSKRLRRLRKTPALRKLVAETRLSPYDLVAPLFVREGISDPEPIESLPGVYQHTLDSLLGEVKELIGRGIPGVILFGVPETKDATGSGAYDPNGIVQVALSKLKSAFQEDIVLIADLCIDEYTDHGHCGVLHSSGKNAEKSVKNNAENNIENSAGSVDNDATLEIYGKVAQAQAEAGADIVAPSGMMDGQVKYIRQVLDANSFEMTPIMAYSAKYASAHYGPFREAANVEIAGGGDRKQYQQDPPNVREALAEINQDVLEGADIVMVKPALSYLDVIAAARQEIQIPLAAYNVSGEYAMVKAGAKAGWIDGEAVALEHLLAIKRAGADIILTYFAKEVAEKL